MIMTGEERQKHRERVKSIVKVLADTKKFSGLEINPGQYPNQFSIKYKYTFETMFSTVDLEDKSNEEIEQFIKDMLFYTAVKNNRMWFDIKDSENIAKIYRNSNA